LLHVYEDGGFSGKNLMRPGIQRLIEDVKARQFDVVIVHKLDRLTRRTRDLWELLDEVFGANGISFVSVTEGFDTSTAAGRLVVNVLGAVAQWEREINSERVKEISQRLKERGRSYGPPPIGKRSVNKHLADDPHEQKIICEARRLRSEGMTLRDIRQSLKEMGYSNRKGNGFLLSVLSRMVAGG